MRDGTLRIVSNFGPIPIIICHHSNRSIMQGHFSCNRGFLKIYYQIIYADAGGWSLWPLNFNLPYTDLFEKNFLYTKTFHLPYQKALCDNSKFSLNKCSFHRTKKLPFRVSSTFFPNFESYLRKNEIFLLLIFLVSIEI